MTPSEERAFLFEAGTRAAWRRLLTIVLQELGYEDIAAGQAQWITEREAAIVQLRTLCEDFGDTEWDERLHLADVIEKHLGRHLYAAERSILTPPKPGTGAPDDEPLG